MKLAGQRTGACYLLAIPAGTDGEPVIKVFTVMADTYDRSMINCNQLDQGTLYVTGDIRLTFVPCP